MKIYIFYLLLILISCTGLLLRVVDYDKVPPQDETFDELNYAWGGASLVRDGVVSTWSNFETYKSFFIIERFGVEWHIVSPQLDKPPFYYLLSGIIVNVFGPQNYFDVTHRVIRLLPLVLSLVSIYLVGILGYRVFSKSVGLLSAILYSTIPTIVLANRLSVTENLIIPFSLLGIILVANKRIFKVKIIITGVLVTLSILTKHIGLVLGATVSLYLYLQNQIKNSMTIVGFTILGVLLYFLYGAFYDFQLFLELQQTVRHAHTLAGVPEFIASVFRFSTIGPKEHAFLDGSILLSLILLFSSPLWLFKNRKLGRDSKFLLVAFPLLYLLLGAVGESGSAPFTYWGWYLFPIFPFAVIILAKFLENFYKKPDLFSLLLIILVVGSSTIRFIFLNLGREFFFLWQYTFIAAILVIVVTHLLFPIRYKKLINLSFFILFILVNIISVIRLDELYPMIIGLASF